MKSASEVIAGVKACGVVAVIRVDNADEAIGAVSAVRAGGVQAVEVTFTVPNAEKIIARLAGELGEDVYLGAGTVTSIEQARMAIEAGAQYLISPGFDAEVVQYALAQGRPFFPGVLTPSEVLAARKVGVEVFKIFPAARMGAAYLKDLRGPFPWIQAIPTGGIDVNNAADYIKAGAVALGVGGKLVDRTAIKAGNWQALTNTAQELIRVVNAARAE